MARVTSAEGISRCHMRASDRSCKRCVTVRLARPAGSLSSFRFSLLFCISACLSLCVSPPSAAPSPSLRELSLTLPRFPTVANFNSSASLLFLNRLSYLNRQVFLLETSHYTKADQKCFLFLNDVLRKKQQKREKCVNQGCPAAGLESSG